MANCKENQHDTTVTGGKNYLICKECNFGYVGIKSANGVHDCVKFNDHTKVKADLYSGDSAELNKPGC